MQTDIDSLVQWSETWQMLFNADKCKVMHIGRNNPGYYYTMGGYAPAGVVLDATSVEKDLGVLIHSSLKPHEQCTSAAKKANIVLGRMARSLTYRDKVTWIKLYRIYVRPHLEYCVQAWSPWTIADMDILESVQKRAINMTSGLHGHSYSYKLKEVVLFSLADRRVRGDMIETWRILNEANHWPGCSIITKASDHSLRVTRGTLSNALVKDKSTADIRVNFFSNRIVSPWNALPTHVRCATSLNSFKSAYDKAIHGVPA